MPGSDLCKCSSLCLVNCPSIDLLMFHWEWSTLSLQLLFSSLSCLDLIVYCCSCLVLVSSYVAGAGCWLLAVDWCDRRFCIYNNNTVTEYVQCRTKVKLLWIVCKPVSYVAQTVALRLTLWRLYCWHRGLGIQLESIQYQIGLSRHLWFLTSGHSDAQGWASECPDVKNYKWRLNPIWYWMLYSQWRSERGGLGVQTPIVKKCVFFTA